MAVFQEARTVHPASYQLWEQMGGYRIRRGDPKSAKVFFDRAVALLPERPVQDQAEQRFILHLLVRLALLSEALDEPAAALELYDQVLAENSEHLLARNRAAALRAGVTTPDEALARLVRMSKTESSTQSCSREAPTDHQH